MIVDCPHCGHDVSDTLDKCPFCSQNLTSQTIALTDRSVKHQVEHVEEKARERYATKEDLAHMRKTIVNGLGIISIGLLLPFVNLVFVVSPSIESIQFMWIIQLLSTCIIICGVLLTYVKINR